MLALDVAGPVRDPGRGRSTGCGAAVAVGEVEVAGLRPHVEWPRIIRKSGRWGLGGSGRYRGHRQGRGRHNRLPAPAHRRRAAAGGGAAGDTRAGLELGASGRPMVGGGGAVAASRRHPPAPRAGPWTGLSGRTLGGAAAAGLARWRARAARRHLRSAAARWALRKARRSRGELGRGLVPLLRVARQRLHGRAAASAWCAGPRAAPGPASCA